LPFGHPNTLVQNGILDLTEWNGGKTIEIAGEWEFYWDSLLTDEDIKNGNQDPILADAPNKWNYYKIDNIGLPGKGKATYRVHVTGAKAGVQYGVRIQNISTVYRLYMDGVLVVQNGNFWDTESSPASACRPQLATFTPKLNDFDLVLQVSNNAFALGGMWEPIIFGGILFRVIMAAYISMSEGATAARNAYACKNTI
jgi:hypothetical protein